jgi:uridine kinase
MISKPPVKTIPYPSALLAIFDRRLPVFERIFNEVKRRKQKDRAFVIGINGIDGAGKTTFAKALEKYLKSDNYQTQAIHLDDFHNPRAVRYSGKDQPDNYYKRSFNINLIIEKLLAPIQQKARKSTRLTLLDVNSDKYDIAKDYSINRDTIVIFEGVFLFRKELAPYIDYKIFLDIPLEESKKRAKERDAPEIVNKYDVKYLPAQVKYLEEYPPPRTADVIIDNTDREYPRLTFLREK